MNRRIELLAPGGDLDSIKAAIIAGADAIYCGLNRFNARNRATNIDLQDLNGILNLAHNHNCSVFIALNIMIVESEFPALVQLLNKLINTGIDGVIIQDLGLFYLLSEFFKGFNIHASTQLNTHNEGQIKFLSKLGADRVNLSRELNLNEIKALTVVGHNHNILIEVFVHGSYCISFSGLCYMSSVHGGNSGNRGRCSQPCRDRYVTTPAGKDFPLNLKDNCAYFDLKQLSEAGVDSIKIEGRIKKFDYVYTVVQCWKKQLQSLYEQNRLINDNKDLYKVFNRDFSNSFLSGDIHKNMFIDNPRDHSIKLFSKIDPHASDQDSINKKIKYYQEKDDIINDVKQRTNQLNIAKTPLTLSLSGKIGKPLIVSVTTPKTSFFVQSTMNLVSVKTSGKNRNLQNRSHKQNHVKETAKRSGGLDYDNLMERFKVLNDTGYYIKHLELENFESDLFISFNEFTAIKKRIWFILNGKEYVDPIDVPVIKKAERVKQTPALSVLISSPEDIGLCSHTDATICFQLPDCFANGCPEWIDLFLENKQLIPWFPPVLIGENYAAAVKFLEQVKPELIVTNNTGIAYEACERNIPWIAGPYLNIANSFSLLCLKEKLNCSGAFISNELSKNQIRTIVPPENFKLYYRIFHPVLLLTSRQCLLHQVIGCDKNKIDQTCIQTCHKSAAIVNLKKQALLIEKTPGNYHRIFHNKPFLNTQIIKDFSDVFSGFCIDLRQIKIGIDTTMDKSGIITVFEALLNGNPDSQKQLEQIMQPSTNTQYSKGI